MASYYSNHFAHKCGFETNKYLQRFSLTWISKTVAWSIIPLLQWPFGEQHWSTVEFTQSPGFLSPLHVFQRQWLPATVNTGERLSNAHVVCQAISLYINKHLLVWGWKTAVRSTLELRSSVSLAVNLWLFFAAWAAWLRSRGTWCQTLNIWWRSPCEHLAPYSLFTTDKSCVSGILSALSHGTGSLTL